jgi:hypothetical protein
VACVFSINGVPQIAHQIEPSVDTPIRPSVDEERTEKRSYERANALSADA